MRKHPLRSKAWWLSVLLLMSCETLQTGSRSSGEESTTSSSLAGRGKMYALLVGVDHYEDGASWGRLRYAEKDVAGVYAVLTGKGRVAPENVTRLLGSAATKERVLEALDGLRTRAASEDTVLLMFAGHGEERNGQSYLVLRDTSGGRLRATGLRALELTTGWKTQRLVVMLDACHSGAGVRGGRSGSRGVEGGHFAGRGRVVLSSSRQSQKSYEEDRLGHGLFSYALMEALEGKADKDGDGVVTMQEAYTYVYRRVVSLAQRYKGRSQEPVLNAQVVGEIPLSYPGRQSAGRLVPMKKAAVNESAKTKQPNEDGTTKATLLKVVVLKRSQAKQVSTRTAGERKVFQVGHVKFAMRWIPAGSFVEGGQTIRISRGFWMNETEVTQGQYQGIEHWQPSAHKTCGSHCPVDMVDWQAAARFSNKLSELKGKQACFACEQGVCRPIKSYVRCRGWRLPTEAEWALAAHAGSATHETDLDLIAWHKGNSTSVHIVGKKQPNAWGLYDMVGNVWELCADSWRTSAFGSQSVDPLVVDNSFLGRLQGRVLRGGSFFRIGPAARILARWKQPERGGQFWTGFRLVYGGQ